MRTGMLVAVEGGPGAGTPSQSKLLCDALAATGAAVHLVDGRKSWLPDETLEAVERRPYPGRYAPLLCRLARMADLGCRQIAPQVAMGYVVVVDRYRHTLLAHTAARGFDVDWVEDLLAPLPPARLSIYLNSPPERQLRRLLAHDEPLEGWEAGTDAVRAASVSGSFRTYQNRVAKALDEFYRRGLLVRMDAEEPETLLAKRLLDQVLAAMEVVG